MANKIISQYTEKTAPVSGDWLLLQDVSDTSDGTAGTYKKVSPPNFGSVVLPAQGTASGQYLTTNGTVASWGTVSGGTASGNVVGPASSTSGHIATYNGTTGKIIQDTLAVVTSLGAPGADTNIPTEAAVRAAISGAGGGDFSGPTGATADNFVSFSGTSGKLGKDSGKSAASYVGTAVTVNGHNLSANVTVSAADAGAVGTATTVNSHPLSGNVTVTASDVGNGSAQWNASQIQGITVNGSAPSANDYLKYDGTTWQHVPVSALGSVQGDGTPILGGNLQLGAYDIQLSGTPGVGSASGNIVAWTAHETLAVGDNCYLASSGRFGKASATDATKVPAVAMALGTAGSANTTNFLLNGIVSISGWNWGTLGQNLYTGTGSGALAGTIGTATGNQGQYVGQALGTNTILYNPNAFITEHT